MELGTQHVPYPTKGKPDMTTPAAYQLQRLQHKAILMAQAAAVDGPDFRDAKTDFLNAVAEFKFACAQLRDECRNA